jgi:hypothetical protein
MSMIKLPVSDWFNFQNQISALISLKIILLLMTVALAVHARLFIIPKLDAGRIALLGWHIAGVTFIAVLMLLAGLSFRYSIL